MKNIIKTFQSYLTESTEYEYISGQGLKLTRFGGLSFFKQKNGNRPDGISKGHWAFVWPFFDWWFMSGSPMAKSGRWTKDGQPSAKPTNYYYNGPIFVRFDIDEFKTNKKSYGILWDDNWYLTHTRYSKELFGKIFAADLKELRKLQHDEPYTKSLPREKYINNILRTKNPYRGYGCLSKDHYEVFVPQRTKELERKYFPQFAK
jgi:hypothetical protein